MTLPTHSQRNKAIDLKSLPWYAAIVKPTFPKSFWFLISGVFINRLGSFLFIYLTYYLTTKRGLSLPQAGFVSTVYAAGAILSGPMGGWLADRMGRRKSMLLATFLGAMMMLHIGFAKSYAHLAVAAFLLGVAGDLYRPAISAAIADMIQPEHRVSAYGWSYWSANMGFSVAALVGGFLSENHFDLLFFLDAGTTLLFGIIFLLFVPETADLHHKPVLAQSPKQPFFATYRDVSLLLFIGIQLFSEFLLQESMIVFPLDVTAHHIPIEAVGYTSALNAILIVCVQPWLQRRVPSYPRRYVLAAGAFALGLGQCLTLLSLWLFSMYYKSSSGWSIHRLALMVGALSPTILWTLGEILMFSVVPATLADLAPVHLRGSYQGAYQITVSVSMLLAPLIGTWSLGHYGSFTTWMTCLWIGLLGAALHLTVGRRIVSTAGGTT